MNLGLVTNNYSGITGGQGALQVARENSITSKYNEIANKLQREENTTVASSQIVQNGRFNGDYTTGYSGTFTSELDKTAKPTGAAANQANSHVKPKTIDKTSELYEKSLELEGFFVKQMLSEMRKTILKANESDFAQNMYEDMLYDEYATAMTKNAGFGLADQIYLSLV